MNHTAPERPVSDADSGGGESACFAHLICPDCGAVLDGAVHAQGCTWVAPGSHLDPATNAGASPDD
jgi:hypothetical protein